MLCRAFAVFRMVILLVALEGEDHFERRRGHCQRVNTGLPGDSDSALPVPLAPRGLLRSGLLLLHHVLVELGLLGSRHFLWRSIVV